MSNKTTLNLSLRASPIITKYKFNYLYRLSLSVNVNVVLFYTCTISNAYNPKLNTVTVSSA